MMNTKTVSETARKMLERVRPKVDANTPHPTFVWLGKSFEMVAGKTGALAALAETKVVTDDPTVILRAAVRLAEQVAEVQAEIPSRRADFKILWQNGVAQNWGLPSASEELRAILRLMDAAKRLEAISTAVQNPEDPASLLLMGSTFPYGIHPLTTGLPEAQLAQLREAFIAKKLPAYISSKEDAAELFGALDAYLHFAAEVARDMGNPGALRQLENDRAARLAAEARLAANE